MPESAGIESKCCRAHLGQPVYEEDGARREQRPVPEPAAVVGHTACGKLVGMINGVHILLYSKDAEADRAFIRDILGFRTVDAGHGWLIFGLPPAELAVHPADGNYGLAQVYLMCPDLRAILAALLEKNVKSSEVREAEWGISAAIPLPSGASLGIYQPIHRTAI